MRCIGCRSEVHIDQAFCLEECADSLARRARRVVVAWHSDPESEPIDEDDMGEALRTLTADARAERMATALRFAGLKAEAKELVRSCELYGSREGAVRADNIKSWCGELEVQLGARTYLASAAGMIFPR